MDNVTIGDLVIEDAGDLGVNFNRIRDGKRATWVNERGAEALREWLNRRHEERRVSNATEKDA